MATVHAHRLNGVIYANVSQIKLLLMEAADQYKDNPERSRAMMDMKKSLDTWEEGLVWRDS